ncbi:MAG: SBBP repeat-containing protein [Candidatus Scalinduaceae bacterium]
MKIKMHKYRRWGLGLIMGWVFIFFGTTIPADVAEAQVTEEWVSRYDGPATKFSIDVANDIALDAAGNVYVTGWSNGGIGLDYATVKYDSSGNELWVARYNGGGNDSANAIAVDGRGNVYVTGSSVGAVDDRGRAFEDYATIKYSQSCEGGIEQLINDVNELGLQKGTSNSLEAKLNTALKSLEDENPNNDVVATNALNAFIYEVEAQRYNHIDNEDAGTLIDAAKPIIDCLSQQ